MTAIHTSNIIGGGNESLYALEPAWLPERDLKDSRVIEKAHRTNLRPVGIFAFYLSSSKDGVIMEIYRVAFIGHREIENYREVEDAITEKLSEFLREKEFVEFQTGRNGEFDIFVAACIKRLQKNFGNHNSAMTLVLP